MNITSIGKDFLKELGIRRSSFSERIIGISKAMDLNIDPADIPQAPAEGVTETDFRFDFLVDVEKGYPKEKITTSQFMFLVATVAFRHHSEHAIYGQNDLLCTNYLMKIFPTVQKQREITPARKDFYQWFIKHRPK